MERQSKGSKAWRRIVKEAKTHPGLYRHRRRRINYTNPPNNINTPHFTTL
jgi:hypothetical protein